MGCSAETWQPSHDKEALQAERDNPTEILEYRIDIDRNGWQTLIIHEENRRPSELKLR